MFSYWLMETACSYPINQDETFSCQIVCCTVSVQILTHLVILIAPNGQQILNLMEQRPIPDEDIAEIIYLFASHSVFVDSMEEADHHIMRIFGKKSAKQEAVSMHFTSIAASGKFFHFIGCSLISREKLSRMSLSF